MKWFWQGISCLYFIPTWSVAFTTEMLRCSRVLSCSDLDALTNTQNRQPWELFWLWEFLKRRHWLNWNIAWKGGTEVDRTQKWRKQPQQDQHKFILFIYALEKILHFLSSPSSSSSSSPSSSSSSSCFQLDLSFCRLTSLAPGAFLRVDKLERLHLNGARSSFLNL